LKSKTILYHAIFWTAIYLLWIIVFRSYAVPITKTITLEFCYLIFITADYYTISNVIVPAFLLKKKYALFIISIVLLVLCSAWLRTLVAIQMNLHFFHPAEATDTTTLYLNSVFNISFWVLLVTIVKMIADRIQTQHQLELLAKGKIAAELDYLKAQINPHALFNSLNTVYGYIDKSNQAARDVLLQFSELLRYQLYDCSAEKIALEKEVAYIKNYIAFQRLRKDTQLIVHLDITAIEPGLTIAPLLLIVLIENAFKFVSNYPDKENKIRITITVENKSLKSSCINTNELPHAITGINSGGIGISNLKRRLALLYPGKYELSISSDSLVYETHLNIDLS
jgi:two-component system LytT family sensor kinase